MGSRFLPATKASPKEMMPIVDKPLIQYAVEEAVAAGIRDMVFITGRNKRAIEDHFDKAYEVEAELTARGKTEMFERPQSPMVAVQKIPREQSRQYGIVKTEPVTDGLDRVMGIVEKPAPEAAPSNLAVVGRYILTPRIFHHLAQAKPGAGSEIQLT